MNELELFRSETRQWLEENCPSALRTREQQTIGCWGGKKWEFHSEDQKIWLDRMIEKGWTVPSWPKEYGGAGLSRDEEQALYSEMQELLCPLPLWSFGIWMLGPALLKFGTEELKKEHLPPIARGEIRWCQGYSEPGAGSDLAGISTKAEDKGDHFLVNGQKVWTSFGDQADAIFVLVRTNPEATKHNGISFVLTTMEQDGIDPRPIKLISGNSEFCEVFFTDARVEKNQVVGTIDRGWDVAKYLLTHEREMIAGYGGDMQIPGLPNLLKEYSDNSVNLISKSGLREKVAELEIDNLAFSTLVNDLLVLSEAGQSLGANSSVMKYYGTELNKRKHELAMEVIGLDAANWATKYSTGSEVASPYLRTKGNSIEGGTSEVMLNIVSKFLLGLPTGK